MYIKDLLIEYRVKNKMTLRDLSELLGVSEGVVSKWENGIRQPKADNLYKINQLINLNNGSESNKTDTVERRNLQNNSGNEKKEAVLLDNVNVMLVPLVNQYAYAGYLDSYTNDTYMNELPRIE